MDKNYYEILEVDKKASNEIIDKAYKTLAKKYHPDLQDGINQEYEDKMKEINEAYAVLSDNNKRVIYDEQLQQTAISVEQYEKILQENRELRQEIQRLTGINMQQQSNSQIFEEQINKAVNQAYYDAYIQDMKDRGYKIKYKRTFKQYMQIAITIVCIILICFLIYQIPFVKKYFTNLYNENIIVKAIVDIFVNTFTTKF